MPESTLDNRVRTIEVTLWGPHTDNGINGEVKRHREQIGELHGKDEESERRVNDRIAAAEDRTAKQFEKVYTLVMRFGTGIILALLAALVAQVLG